MNRGWVVQRIANRVEVLVLIKGVTKSALGRRWRLIKTENGKVQEGDYIHWAEAEFGPQQNNSYSLIRYHKPFDETSGTKLHAVSNGACSPTSNPSKELREKFTEASQ